MDEEYVHEFYRADAQRRLDAAGFSDVTALAGHFKNGDGLRFEIRLNGARASQARKHLPFSDNEE
jgi:hypothetical protein